MSSFKNDNTGIQPVNAAGLERVFQHQIITSQVCPSGWFETHALRAEGVGRPILSGRVADRRLSHS